MISSNTVQLYSPHKYRGFTLIEVMVVVAIVGILLAIALPGYQNSMQKSRRADAKSALLDAGSRQEQYMLDQGTYTDDMEDLGYGASPFISEELHYSIGASGCAGGDITRCYVLTATPHSGSPQQDDDRCTEFVLGSDGSKTASGTDQANCW